MKQQEDSTSELRFPAGMRVLVVDDDNTCLKLMENLLRKCQYHVTTTNRPEEALKILRDGRNRYDIVISDVEMPGPLDGMKLLHIIGLEMKIPVIMLSAYSDTKRVMQGIKHGACDYLVKPVRIQELQNIWQHLVRKKKPIPLRRPMASAAEEIERAPVLNNVKTERLRGNSFEDDSSGGDDNNDNDEQGDSGHENGETTTRKKPRLFWSVELHQKFVDAVNSLGIEKAFPKKILDLMNVEGLTREKVASHLQKYRLYLKKVSEGSDQTASKMSVFEDGHIGQIGGGYGLYRSLAGGTSRFSGINPSFSPHPQMFGRLNTSSGLSIRGLASSPMLQTNPNNTLFQGFPSQQQNRASFVYPPSNSIMPSQNPFQNQPSSSMGTFDGTSGSFTNLLDPNRCPPNWGNSPVHPQPFQNNMLVSSNGTASHMANMQNDQLDYLGGFDGLKGNLETQNGVNSNAVNSFNYFGQTQTWQDHKSDHILDSYNTAGASTSQLTPVVTSSGQYNANISASPFSQLEGASSQLVQQPNANGEQNTKLDDFLLDEPKIAGPSGNGSSEYLEDIVGRFLKQENGETEQTGDDFDIDSFTI